MALTEKPKRHRFPLEMISHAVWSYQHFNDSYRDVQERLRMRGLVAEFVKQVVA